MCQIEVEMDFDSVASFYKVAELTARKQYRCSECQRPIQPGARYERAVGKWDGQFETFRTYPTCLEIRKRFISDGVYHGGLWGELQEGCEDIELSQLDGLSAEAVGLLEEWLPGVFGNH